MRNFLNNINRTTLLGLSAGALLLTIGSLVVYLNFTKSPSAPDSSAKVVSVAPDQSVVLTAGKPYEFNIYFDKPINPNDLSILLSYIDIATDSKPIFVKTALSSDESVVLVLKTLESVKENGEYILLIKSKKTGVALSSTHYLSGVISPTPVPSNNSSLKKYLPYETDSFILRFVPQQNIYVSHFKYDTNLSTSLNDQYEKAKTEVINFIQSKGIDPQTIVIEFRRT